jgi:ABC-type transport system involved in multi-copper enzyme maturation permease subunit
VSDAAGCLERVLAIAGNGVRQAVRDKALVMLAAFCAILVLGSVVVSSLTVGERTRIVVDLGLSVISILTTLTAVLVSIGQVAREIERRTVDTILSKPVARWELLLGRFLGMAATLAIMVAVMGALHAAVLAVLGGLDPQLPHALFLGWVEAVLVSALALFFSTFTTSMPSVFITLGFVVIGHASWSLALMARSLQSRALQELLHVLYVVLPNLELMNVRDQVAWDVAVSGRYVAWATLYGLAYSGLLIVLGAAILSRRDLA